MKHAASTRLLVAIVTVAILLGGMWWLPRITAGRETASDQAGVSAAQQAVIPRNGNYQGSVSLGHVYQGVFSADPVATPAPMDLGQIDLSLHLEQMGDKAGFVMLDRTLVFRREHQIMVTPTGPTPGPGTPTPTSYPLDIGPYVKVTPDGSALRLVSDPYTMTLNGREITRQFSLFSPSVPTNSATLTGTYRETVWGYALQPSTVMGTFTLQRPVFPPISPQVAVSVSQTSVTIAWQQGSTDATYQVWRGTTPYFGPGDANTVIVGDGATGTVPQHRGCDHLRGRRRAGQCRRQLLLFRAGA